MNTWLVQPLVWAYMGIVLDGLLQGLCMACSWLVEEVDDADPDEHASGWCIVMHHHDASSN